MASSKGSPTYRRGAYQIYFEEFREFIRDELVKEPEYHIPNSHGVLNTMLEPGFSELVSDLYEEIQRRKAGANGRPKATLPTPHKDYHSKRNETRIKLASARISKIKSLVSEVYYELERRFPEFKTVPQTRQASTKENQEYASGWGLVDNV